MFYIEVSNLSNNTSLVLGLGLSLIVVSTAPVWPNIHSNSETQMYYCLFNTNWILSFKVISKNYNFKLSVISDSQWKILGGGALGLVTLPSNYSAPDLEHKCVPYLNKQNLLYHNLVLNPLLPYFISLF